MKDGARNDPESRLAMVLFLHLGGWRTHAQLAQAAGIARSQVSEYFEGKRAIPRPALEKIAAASGFPVYLLDLLLREIRSFRAAGQGRSRAGRAFAGGVAIELMALVQRAADLILEPREETSGITPPGIQDRPEAATLWNRLEECTAEERRILVEELDEYRTWALCERWPGRASPRRRTTLGRRWSWPSWRGSSPS